MTNLKKTFSLVQFVFRLTGLSWLFILTLMIIIIEIFLQHMFKK